MYANISRSHWFWRGTWGTTSRPEAWRGGTVLPGLARTVPHHFAVDGTADTVVQLHIQFGQNVGVKHTGFRDVPYSRSLHNISDDKLLDGFVLGHTPGTVCAADGLDMSTSLLSTTVIPPLLSLGDEEIKVSTGLQMTTLKS